MFEINRAPWPRGGSHAHLDLASAAARALPPSLPACLPGQCRAARAPSIARHLDIDVDVSQGPALEWAVSCLQGPAPTPAP